MRTRLAAASILLFCLAGPAAADGPVTLRYKLAKGETLRYRNQMEMSQTQKIMGQTISTNMTMQDVTLRTVDDVDKESNIHLNVKNEQLKVSAEFAGQPKYEFDSAKEKQDSSGLLGPQLTPLFEKLSGSEVKVEISPTGKVRSVKGYREIVEEVVKANPVAAQIANAQSDEAIKLNFQESYPDLNEKAVKSGDTWEVPFELDMAQLGKITGKKLYEFIGPDKVGNRETLRINVTIDISFDLDVDMMGAKVTGKFATNNSSGTIQFDPSAGRVVLAETTMTMAGDFNVSAGGQNIPLQMEQTQKVKLELIP